MVSGCHQGYPWQHALRLVGNGDFCRPPHLQERDCLYCVLNFAAGLLQNFGAKLYLFGARFLELKGLGIWDYN